MLRQADIDAVDICTGHASHAPLTIAAAEAGKHVIVEKVMGTTLEGCRAMIEGAQGGGDIDGRPERVVFAGVRRRQTIHRRRKLGDIHAVRTHVIMAGPAVLDERRQGRRRLVGGSHQVADTPGFRRVRENGSQPISSGRDNLETVKIVIAIQESSRTGRIVDLDEL